MTASSLPFSDCPSTPVPLPSHSSSPFPSCTPALQHPHGRSASWWPLGAEGSGREQGRPQPRPSSLLPSLQLCLVVTESFKPLLAFAQHTQRPGSGKRRPLRAPRPPLGLPQSLGMFKVGTGSHPPREPAFSPGIHLGASVSAQPPAAPCNCLFP